MDKNDVAALDAITGKIKICLGNIAKNAVEVGNQLIQAKQLVNHGEWQKWLANNFSLSQDTASNFMNIAKRFGAKSDTPRNLNYSQMRELVKLPANDMWNFIEIMDSAGTPVESMSSRNLRYKVKALKSPMKPAPEKALEPVTIDATPPKPAPKKAVELVTTKATPLPLALALFSPQSNSPSGYQPPRELIAAARKCDAELKIICRAEHPPEIAAPLIVVAVGKITSGWIVNLATKATALINSKITFRLGNETAAKKNCVILYFGDDADSFKRAFLEFGLTLFTGNKKAPVS